MQTVPTLVGTGTAIAAAASGYVFGQSTEQSAQSTVTHPRALPESRPSTQEASIANQPIPSPPESRPGTGLLPSTASVSSGQPLSPPTLPVSRPPLSTWGRPQSAQVVPQRNSSRRHSLVRHNDFSTSTIPETPRDSFSSNGSWMRRLSIRPLSQHGSPRSSVGPNSPSITFSHSSAAPILGPLHDITSPLPPNKLVKRTTSSHVTELNPVPRRRSRSHLPTLRRPATSHQRSATLHQLSPGLGPSSPTGYRAFSEEERSFANTRAEVPVSAIVAIKRETRWISYFHNKTNVSSSKSTPGRFPELSPGPRLSTTRRITPGRSDQRKVHLVKSTMVTNSSPPADRSPAAVVETQEANGDDVIPPPDKDEPATPAAETPRRMKRSISMSFSSAGQWVSRTSGSIRRPKRDAETPASGRRHVSEPLQNRQGTPGSASRFRAGESRSPAAAEGSDRWRGQSTPENAIPRAIRSRGMAISPSSPLPPLSRLSTFQVDLFPSASTGRASPSFPVKPTQPSGSSTSSMGLAHARMAHDRSSSMMGSDADTRDFMSGDDETDYKSETMFDSIRTFASARPRALDTPVDSMYDESPPSTAGNGKTKRLSIQEILGSAWDGENKITEEDETASTPIRTSHATYTGMANRTSPIPTLQPAPQFTRSSREVIRASLDDEFDDDDWARFDDDDAPYNPLSPLSASKGGSVNSATINPNIKMALANMDKDGLLDLTAHNTNATGHERPLSNLFDWSEQTSQDRQDAEGHSPRPKTAYAKQEMDTRGGRSAIRKGPTPTHVRSQSVPVVHEVSEDAKPTGAKYGTWGLGTKTASEDWDDDFEFNGPGNDNNDKDDERMFAVPEAIRATQPSVKAHSGQIRELSLLVNDLKRLCRHGRDLGMIDGPHRAFWKEAEGIIALASPDEDDTLDDHMSSSSIDLDAFDLDDRFGDDTFGAVSSSARRPSTDTWDLPSSLPEPTLPKHRPVLFPEDNIFGDTPPPMAKLAAVDASRPRTPLEHDSTSTAHDVDGVVRSMVSAMQPAADSGVWKETGHRHNRMHFDTNSLKALVKRAGDLRDTLSDMIRKADQITQSPIRTPRHDRHVESSPAFTRVFDDPGSSPPRRLTAKSRGKSALAEKPTESSPSAITRSMQAMTVS